MARFTIKGTDVFVEQWQEDATDVLVLLHGFTGSTATWHRVVAQMPANIRCIAVDLMGHGKTAAPAAGDPYSMAFQIGLLDELFRHLQLERFTLAGYSMGGRVALSYAVQHPEKIKQLLLESASPGLADEQQRTMRRQADDALAEKILAYGVEAFIDKWEMIPLFASQKALPAEIRREVRQERTAQQAIGLANSLRGMGTGVMPSLWGQPLQLLQMPVTLITGALDEKFVQLNREMQKQMPHAKHYTIPETGHAIHVENPTKFATIVKETIS